jgi:hypothetical protein
MLFSGANCIEENSDPKFSRKNLFAQDIYYQNENISFYQLSANMPTKSRTKSRRKKKYMFTLVNINTENIDQRYGITLPSNITDAEPVPVNTTMIDDLGSTRKTPEVISFLDESKRLIKCDVSMIDLNTGKIIGSNDCYHCFWCRHAIPTGIRPVGCPLKYVPHQAVKSYYSEITKDRYTIKENITEKTANHVENINDKRLSLIKKGYYSTDGAFCSFNCCMAFIENKRRESRFKDAQKLLLKMYNSMNEEEVDFIEPAHHWRKLRSYGGNLTIEQFRSSFGRIEYLEHGYVLDRPKCVAAGMLFEEKLRF